MPPSPKRQYHMSDPPSSAESRTVTFPIQSHRNMEGRYPLTQVDLAMLGPKTARSPDRQRKSVLQSQESPGWSFVMKNEDYGYEYPNKSRGIATESQPRTEPVTAASFFKRSSDTDGDKPRRHLLSFGKKKSKAPAGGSPGRKGASSPRPMMPSPKRPPRPNPAAQPEAEEDDSLEFSTSPVLQHKTPPTPPKVQTHRMHKQQASVSAADLPLPPSPTPLTRHRDRAADGDGNGRGNGDDDTSQESPLEAYFLPSPAPGSGPLRTASPSKKSFEFPHLQLSRNASSLSHNTDTLPTRQGLRDVMLASIDLLLEDHYTSLDAVHGNQLRRISHLERTSQEASLALIQSQKDYTALESTLLAERDQLASTLNELNTERETRQAQAKESTALIAQLENQLSSSKRTIQQLEHRSTTLQQSLTQSQNEIDRLEKEMTKGYDEIKNRLSGVERLERDAGDWRKKAEEAEFTVRALREEGVRMSRELERKSRAIEELEKGRKFVTRV